MTTFALIGSIAQLLLVGFFIWTTWIDIKSRRANTDALIEQHKALLAAIIVSQKTNALLAALESAGMGARFEADEAPVQQ